MFTGLIEETGIVRGIEGSGAGIYLTISSKLMLDGIKTGDSISIDGACLTVTRFDSSSFTVFASKVTCGITTLGSFTAGRRVNLERAMQAGARFGGHIVQGHVDGMGRIKAITRDESGLNLEISASAEISKYLVAKGSVAVDGISLTVVSLTQAGFTVYIIPETIKNTTLSEKAQGVQVNIEPDILAKYVERMTGIKKEDEQKKDERLKRTLMEGGFI